MHSLYRNPSCDGLSHVVHHALADLVHLPLLEYQQGAPHGDDVLPSEAVEADGKRPVVHCTQTSHAGQGRTTLDQEQYSSASHCTVCSVCMNRVHGTLHTRATEGGK